jgi:hypothetical protein
MKKNISLTIPKESGFTHVLFNIAAQGFDYIKIHYSGGGDSGGIDDVYLLPTGCVIIEDGRVEDESSYDEYTHPDDELQEIIANKAYENILHTAEDWWNNDGGGGTLYISTLDGSYYGNHYVNETITHDSQLSGKLGD